MGRRDYRNGLNSTDETDLATFPVPEVVDRRNCPEVMGNVTLGELTLRLALYKLWMCSGLVRPNTTHSL